MRSMASTVHFVTEQLDGGPRMIQARVAVSPGDTEATLSERVLAQEHHHLSAWRSIGSARDDCAATDGKAWLDGRALIEPVQLSRHRTGHTVMKTLRAAAFGFALLAVRTAGAQAPAEPGTRAVHRSLSRRLEGHQRRHQRHRAEARLRARASMCTSGPSLPAAFCVSLIMMIWCRRAG